MIPPRAVSSTAASDRRRRPAPSRPTAGRTRPHRRSAARRSTRRPWWTCRPSARPGAGCWPIMRTVVVFPFVPVTATTGIRAGVPGGYRLSMIAPATSRGVPRPGQVHPQPGAGVDLDHRAAARGRPAPSGARCRPAAGRRRRRPGRPRRRRGGTCRRRPVHEVGDVPAGPAGRQVRVAPQRNDLTVGGTLPGSSPCPARCASALSSSRIFVSGREWPSPRRGSPLTRATSSPISLRPSPVTAAGHSSRRGHTCPSTTSTR